MSPWTLALALAGAVAYAVLCHLLMVRAAASPWAVVLVLGPLVVLSAVAAFKSRQRLLLAGTIVVGAGLLVLVPRGHLGNPIWLYLAQHAGTHAALGVAFAATLRRPLSMIGTFAQRVHPTSLTPDLIRYTRAVTVSWVVYFFGMTLVSVALVVAGAREAWSFLATIGTPVLIAALLVGEYLLRYRLHPEFERVPFRAALRAYRDHAAARDGGGSAAAGEVAP